MFVVLNAALELKGSNSSAGTASISDVLDIPKQVLVPVLLAEIDRMRFSLHFLKPVLMPV
jgi:hypothetical protein